MALKTPDDDELIATLADLRATSIFGVKNLRQVPRRIQLSMAGALLCMFVLPQNLLHVAWSLNRACCCAMQAILSQHPDWCVGEKRIKRLNRALNESFLHDSDNGMEMEIRNAEGAWNDCGWEDLLSERTTEMEWILVDIPTDL